MPMTKIATMAPMALSRGSFLSSTQKPGSHPKFKKDALGVERPFFWYSEKSEVLKRGWRSEEVVAKKSFRCQRLKPLFCAISPMPPWEKGNTLLENLLGCFGDLFVANPLPPTPFRNLRKKRAGVKQAYPNEVMARMCFMHDAHLGCAFLFLDILAGYALLSMTVMVTPCIKYVVGMKLVMSCTKLPQAPFARAPFGECQILAAK